MRAYAAGPVRASVIRKLADPRLAPNAANSR